MTDFVVPPGQKEAQHRFEEAANYNAWLYERGRPFVGARVLDFGAGIGPFTELLAAHADVVALEPDPGFQAVLRERFDDRPNVSMVESEEALSGAFDTIVCLNVLEHIGDDEGTLRRLRERLASGGHLLLLVPAHTALYGEIDRNVGHERRYNRRLLRRHLESAGLEIVELRYVNPVGALGWLVSSRLLGRDQVPTGPLKIYDTLVPLLRPLDRLRLPFGLSLWAVARKRP